MSYFKKRLGLLKNAGMTEILRRQLIYSVQLCSDRIMKLLSFLLKFIMIRRDVFDYTVDKKWLMPTKCGMSIFLK